MTPAETSKSCPRCGLVLRTTARFCDACGFALDQSEAFTEILTRKSALSTDSSIDPLIGRIVNSKYLILAEIAKGGMGVVYLVRRLQLSDRVIIKFLDDRYVASDRALLRFRREAEAAARIKHPNVVMVHDYCEAQNDGTSAFIVMEHVPGLTLKVLLANEGRLELSRTISIMHEICRGVGAGHHSKVIHRDIKPSNIMVFLNDEGTESVKVLDFGLAKLRDENADPSITHVGVIVGTPSYMSPEQCRGEVLSERSDIYGLGVVTYEMLTGKLPFDAISTDQARQQHLRQPPPPFPPELGIPAKVEAVVFQALSKNPDDRYESAVAYSQALQDALAGTERPSAGKLESDSAVALAENDKVKNQFDSILRRLPENHLILLDWPWKRTLERGRVQTVRVEEVIESFPVETRTSGSIGHTLEILQRAGYLDAGPVGSEEALFSTYSLTPAGFDEYGTTYVEKYASTKRDVLNLIAKGDIDDDLKLATLTNQPKILIDQILEILCQKRLLGLSIRMGGKVAIDDVSNELRQMVEDSDPVSAP